MNVTAGTAVGVGAQATNRASMIMSERIRCVFFKVYPLLIGYVNYYWSSGQAWVVNDHKNECHPLKFRRQACSRAAPFPPICTLPNTAAVSFIRKLNLHTIFTKVTSQYSKISFSSTTFIDWAQIVLESLPSYFQAQNHLAKILQM